MYRFLRVWNAADILVVAVEFAQLHYLSPWSLFSNACHFVVVDVTLCSFRLLTPLLLLLLQKSFISEHPKAWLQEISCIQKHTHTHTRWRSICPRIWRNHFVDRCFFCYLRFSHCILILCHFFPHTHSKLHWKIASAQRQRAMPDRKKEIEIVYWLYVPEPNSKVLHSFIIYFNQSTVALSCTFHFVNVFSQSLENMAELHG